MSLGTLLVTRVTAEAIVYPLLLGGVSIIGSIIGCQMVKTDPDKKVMSALYKGSWWSAILSLVGFIGVTWWGIPENMRFQMIGASITGIILTGLMVYITEYYGSRLQIGQTYCRDVDDEAWYEYHCRSRCRDEIDGLAGSGGLCVAIYVTYQFCGGLYGVAVTATSMLSMAGIVVALDACGPITDNVGSIAEMASMPDSVRAVTD